ncbi:MAG: 3-deoxy-8-phosphooctulonate synthase [Phycisphaerae bacterium]|nr:3-deoxy-8-phosphooctulonate synthase [Phycisphaerae bacterium]
MTQSIIIGGNGIGEVILGGDQKMFVMAGPCVIESKDICFEIAMEMIAIADALDIGYAFKASFDKANRTSISSFRGPGLEKGLEILADIRKSLNVPVVTDIHLPDQAQAIGQVVDVIQIPAFLARQTDLLAAAAATGKVVQVKKGQFMAPWDMENVIGKIKDSGNDKITLVERGSSFGYNRLVCDMTGICEMKKFNRPVIMDATHSTQQPGGLGNSSGGSPEFAPVLARCAMAAKADGLFIETHPEPSKGLSDAACMMKLEDMKPMLKQCRDIFQLVRQQG